tara:strand:+ start:301 stop:1377 length:1077 start_codon:yes stop_codon:yes gene_type:complete
MGLTKTQSGGLEDQSVSLDKLPHGTSSNDGKFLRANNGADPSFETVSTDLVADSSPQLGGNLTSNGNNIIFADTTGASNNRLVFGGNTDMSIYHLPNNNYIDADTGTLHIRHSGETGAKFIKNGGVELFHDNVKKVETTNYGALFSDGKIIIDDGSTGHAFFDLNNAGLHIGSGTTGFGAYKAIEYNANKHQFYYQGGLRQQLDNDGIKFNGDTAAANALDDYEEGTFTPYIDRENGSPIIGYDAQDGYYTKIGRVVYFYAEVRISSYNGNGSYGYTFLRGLPFNAAARTGGRGVWDSVTYHSYYRDMTTTDGERDIAAVLGSSEKVAFYIQRSEQAWTAPPAPDANDQFKIGGFYFT